MTRPVCWSKSWRLTPRMQDPPAVEQQVQAADLDATEADPDGMASSTTSPSGDREVTRRSWRAGRLGGPAGHVRDLEVHLDTAGAASGASAVEVRVPALPVIGSRPSGPPTMSAEQDDVAGSTASSERRERQLVRGADAGAQPVGLGLDDPAGRRRDPGEPESTVRSSVPVVRSSARPAIARDVGEVDGARGVQEDGAGDAAVPPLVLVLDVGRVGPFHDAQRQGVGARP